MYTVYESYSWDPLLDYLAGDSSPLGTDPFEAFQPRVIPQSELVKRWLEMRLADRGRVFTPAWSYPGPLFSSLVGRVFPELLPVSPSELSLIAQEVSGQPGRWRISTETAQLIAGYADNFPEVLEAWSAGRQRHGTDAERLWDELVARQRLPLGWLLHRAVREDRVLPEPFPAIVVVGAPFLSVSAQRFLLRLGQTSEIHHFFLRSPAPDGLVLSGDVALDTLFSRGSGVRRVVLGEKASPPEIRVTGCWGPRRELEEAAEAIFQFLSREEGVRAESFALLAPDWTPYLPFLDEVFGDDVAKVSLLSGPVLEIQCEDRPSQEEQLARRLIELLGRTASGRWTRSLLEALVNHPWLSVADDAGDWEGWGEAAGFRWGRTAAETKEESPCVAAAVSLEDAWERFAQSLGPGSGVPEPSWQQARGLGRVMDTLAAISRAWERAGKSNTFAAWVQAWMEAGDPLIRPHAERWAIKLQRGLLVSGDHGDAPFNAEDFQQMLALSLRQEGYKPQLLVRGLSAGSLNRLRSIPFDTVIVLGMDESFPRGDTPIRDDTLYEHPSEWSRLLTTRDTLGRTLGDTRLWYDALGAAGKRFWVFYTSREREKGESRLPTPLLAGLETPAEPVQTALYHWEASDSGDRSTVFRRYAGIGADLAAGKRRPGVWDQAGWQLPAAPPAAEPELQVWLEPLPSLVKGRLGYKPVNRWEEDPDREGWDLKSWDWIPWVLEWWSREGLKTEGLGDWLTMQWQERVKSGFLAEHPLSPEWLRQRALEAGRWTEGLEQTLGKGGKVVLLPGLSDVGAAETDLGPVLFSLKTHKLNSYRDRVSFHFARVAAGRIFGRVPEKAWAILEKPEKKSPHAFGQRVWRNSFDPELAWEGLRSGQDSLLAYPFFFPSFSDTSGLATKDAQTVWEMSKDALEDTPYATSATRKFREALEWVAQGRELPQEVPEEFASRYRSWQKENPWLAE